MGAFKLMSKLNSGGTPERLAYEKHTASEAESAVLFHHLLPYHLTNIEALCDRFGCPGPREFECLIDFGCGNGWGANFLSQSGLKVIGYDIDKSVIEANRKRFPTGPTFTSTFRDIVKSGPRFVIAYQSLEHADDHAKFLDQVRLASSGGIAIIVTPDRRDRLFPGQRPWNRFHTFEHSPVTLAECVETVTTSYSIGVIRFRKADMPERKRTRRLRVLLAPALWLPSPVHTLVLSGINRVRRRFQAVGESPEPSFTTASDELSGTTFGLEVTDVLPGLLGDSREKGINLVAVLDFRGTN